MYYTLFRVYRDFDGTRKENDPSDERPKLSLLSSFSGTRSPKLSFSATTNKLVRYKLIAGENDSLGG